MESARPGILWADTTRRINSMLNDIEDLGGIRAVAARWEPRTKAIVVAQLDEIIAALVNWKQALTEDADGPACNTNPLHS